MIEFFRRKKSGKKRRSSAGRRLRKLPVKPLAPVEEIVEQGILVADVAIRMSVKNTIIMNALRHGKDYDVSEVHDLVRETTLELAAERERDATHIRRVRDEIRKYGRSAWQESEYATDDMRTLKHRQEVYEQMRAVLEGQAENAAFVAETAAQAREAAWGEIGESLKERATHPYYSGGASQEYQRERDERIEQFIAEDLTALLKETGQGKTEESSGLFGKYRKPKKG